jgi:phospholipid/cholesterol/gamma-HCH transport system substrate-binding protein
VGAVGDLAAQLEAIAKAGEKGSDLAMTIHNFREASNELRDAVRENRRSLKATLDNFADAARTTKSLTTDREAQLKRAMDDFASAADKLERLSGRLDSLRASIQSVSEKVDRGQGTLGKLVNDDRLYTDLSGAVHSLRVLVEDIKANPKKYLKVEIF